MPDELKELLKKPIVAVGTVELVAAKDAPMENAGRSM